MTSSADLVKDDVVVSSRGPKGVDIHKQGNVNNNGMIEIMPEMVGFEIVVIDDAMDDIMIVS